MHGQQNIKKNMSISLVAVIQWHFSLPVCDDVY